MGDVANFPISLDSDLGRELIVDCVRFAEGLLDERAVRKKYRFDDSAWEALGNNDELVEKIENEKLRRIRDGSSKRERAQQLIVKAPGILDSIASDVSASPRHRVDAIRTLDSFTNGPGASAPATDRFQITINLGADLQLKFDKSRKPDVDDVDPHHIDDTPQGLLPMIAAKKGDGGGGDTL